MRKTNITSQGILEYIDSFYAHLGMELSAEDKAGLEPLIAQAHDKGIPTTTLVEVVLSFQEQDLNISPPVAEKGETK